MKSSEQEAPKHTVLATEGTNQGLQVAQDKALVPQSRSNNNSFFYMTLLIPYLIGEGWV